MTQITIIYCVPSMLLELVNAEDTEKYDLSSLKRVYCGAAPTAPDVIRRMIQKYGVEFTAGIYNIYLPCYKQRSC